MANEENPSDYVNEEVPTPPISDEVWKQILDRRQIPESFIHTLKGERGTFTEKDGYIYPSWESDGMPVMNDIGINVFKPFIYSVVTVDKLITRITEEEVNRLMRDMMKAIVKIIAERGDEFNIPPSGRNLVVQMFEQYCFMNLTASRRGTLIDVLKPTFERKEVYTPQQRPRFKFPSFLGGSE